MSIIECRAICDTREKEPWDLLDSTNFPSSYKIVQVDIEALGTADYTLLGYDISGYKYSVGIERKRNIEELIGNIGTNWERFKRELEELSKYDYKYIIVEDDLHDIYAKYKSRRGYVNVSPEFILSRISEIETVYRVNVIFLSNRTLAIRYVHNLFKRIIQQDNKNDSE